MWVSSVDKHGQVSLKASVLPPHCVHSSKLICFVHQGSLDPLTNRRARGYLPVHERGKMSPGRFENTVTANEKPAATGVTLHHSVVNRFSPVAVFLLWLGK